MKAKSNKKMTFGGCVFCMTFFLSILCLPSTGVEAKEVTTLKFAGGSLGSYQHSYVTVLTELLRKKLPDLEFAVGPGVSNSNVIAVNQRKVDLGVTLSPSAFSGYRGETPFKEENKKIREVIALADNPLTIVVWADSGIAKITDFRGKRLNVTPRGYTSEFLSRIILKTYGMGYEDLKKAEYVGNPDGILLMKDGHIDGMVIVAGRYASYVFDLASSKPIRIVPFDPSNIAEIHKQNRGVVECKLPASMYKQPSDVLTIACWFHLIASEDLSESLVYEITKVAVENIKVLNEFSQGTADLTPELMATDLGIPFHPGALKYFKEKGIR